MPDSGSVFYLDLSSPSRRLAYRYIKPDPGKPTVVFLHGFRSDMTGEKVQYTRKLCMDGGTGFLSFDYSGHGLSSGKFEEGTITQWLEDALGIIDHLTQGPVIIVGSSMGGWLAFLTALKRPEKIIGLVGIAPAPDFTQDLIWDKFTTSQLSEIIEHGRITIHNEYTTEGWIITRNLIESGRKHLLLGGSIPLNISVRLLHGMEDATVPVAYSHKLVELLTGADVTLTLIKTGDHRLSRPEDLQLLGQTVKGISGQ